MTELNTDVMIHHIADHQAHLRALGRKQALRLPGTPSRMRQAAGHALIRLGEQIRGEIRDAGPAPAQSRLAAH